MSKSELEVQAWFLDLIHDQKYFTARWAKKYSEIAGVEVEVLIKSSILFLLGLLIVLKEPHYLANGLLVIVPIIVNYMEPTQKPEARIQFIYWIFFGIFALFDRILEYIPLYYVFKLVIFVALFLPPSNPSIELINKRIGQLEKK